MFWLGFTQSCRITVGRLGLGVYVVKKFSAIGVFHHQSNSSITFIYCNTRNRALVCQMMKGWCRDPPHRNTNEQLYFHYTYLQNTITSFLASACSLFSRMSVLFHIAATSEHVVGATRARLNVSHAPYCHGPRHSSRHVSDSWLDLVDLIAPWLGVEPATFRSRVQCSTAASPRQPDCLLQTTFAFFYCFSPCYFFHATWVM